MDNLMVTEYGMIQKQLISRNIEKGEPVYGILKYEKGNSYQGLLRMDYLMVVESGLMEKLRILDILKMGILLVLE